MVRLQNIVKSGPVHFRTKNGRLISCTCRQTLPRFNLCLLLNKKELGSLRLIAASGGVFNAVPSG